MALLTIDQESSEQSCHDLRNAKLRHTLHSLFHTLHKEVHDELMLKLKWVEIRGGEVLFHQGEEGDSLYILVTGRMKALINADTEQEREVGEISQGECVGEMALMTGEARTATIYAIRDCMLARLSKEDFQELLGLHPQIALSFSRLIINRLTYTMHHSKAPAKTFNIALVPATNDIHMQSLVDQLLGALQQQGSTKHLSRELLAQALNPDSNPSEAKAFELHSWLTEQEMNHDCVLYQADAHYSAWTQQCLRQADKIVIITDSRNGAALSGFEEEVFVNKKGKYPQSKELVILYPEDTEMPAISHQIVAQREVSRHYNIRMNDSNHIERLARMITDKGIGLVLSGGGAKGFAHLGIYKALKEAGVPIDMVCGTSMGSIIAAAIANDWDVDKMMKTGRSAFLTDKPLNDYTLPVISLIKGHKLQKINRKYFGDYHIEDLWLNFFCVSGNYTISKMVIHDKGPVWKAVTASVAIPGVLPPVVDGNYLLVDGSVFNNFPVDLMKAKYGGKLIGVDLLADKEYTLNYTRLPSGWHLFMSKFLPFLKRYKAPSIASIMIKSTVLASTEHQRNQIPDLEMFLSPPVANFGFLDMKNYDRIVATGYEYARDYLKGVEVNQLVGKEIPQALAS
jgi:NTE family protein